jgi:allophanate hydrolase subunit 2
LPGRFGGHFGRNLIAHDHLQLGNRRFPPPRFNKDWLSRLPEPREVMTARFLPGPGWETISAMARTRIASHGFQVSPDSNRAGVRLNGKIPCKGIDFAAPSEPVVPGTIELTNDGNLIVLLADGPTTGGYPKPGVIIQADIPVVAQRKPGATLRFVEVTPTVAVTAANIARAHLTSLAAHVRPKSSNLPDLVNF